MGYPLADRGSDETAQVCRIIKWDVDKQLLVIVGENVILESAKPRGSLAFVREMHNLADEKKLENRDDASDNLVGA